MFVWRSCYRKSPFRALNLPLSLFSSVSSSSLSTSAGRVKKRSFPGVKFKTIFKRLFRFSLRSGKGWCRYHGNFICVFSDNEEKVTFLHPTSTDVSDFRHIRWNIIPMFRCFSLPFSFSADAANVVVRAPQKGDDKMCLNRRTKGHEWVTLTAQNV